MELYLIRHAQSLNNARPVMERVEDPSLTELGQQQASHLAEWVSRLGLTRVVTSPFLRTLETAEHIRRTTQLEPDVQADLHEQGGCVSGEHPELMVGRPGRTRSQIAAEFPGFKVGSEIDGEGWWRSQPYESEEAARHRAARVLARTRARFGCTQERVAYITHGDFKRLLLQQLQPDDLEVPFNTSITKILISGDETTLADYNRVDHLPDQLRTY